MQKGALQIVIGIIVAVLVIGGGAYYFGTKQAVAPVAEEDELLPPAEKEDVVATNSVTKSSPDKIEAKATSLLYTDNKNGFSLAYPADWTYQVFSCNVDGVAFCPLVGNKPMNCGQICGMDSPEPPIVMYIASARLESKTDLSLRDARYQRIYDQMVLSFKTIAVGQEVVTAFVKEIKGGKVVLDYFEILTGEAAVEAKIADGKCERAFVEQCFPNGKIYYRNQNTLLRTFELDPKIVILTAFEFDKSLNGVVQISVEEFNRDFVQNPAYDIIGHKVTLRGNVVVKIEQIFRP